MFTSGWKSSQLSVQFVKIENCMMALCPAVQLAEKKTKQCGFNVIKIVDNLYVNNVSLVSVEEKNQINFKVALLPFWSLKKIYLGLVTFDQVYPCIPRMRVIKIQKYCDFSFLDRFDKQRCCQLICKPSQGGPLSWRRRQLR